MQKTKFISVIVTVQSYLENEEIDWILTTVLPKLQEKVQYIRGERKLNFGTEITEILVLPKLGGVPERENNYGNQVAEIVGMRREKIWIVATKLPKIGGKKNFVATKLPKMKEKKRCYVHNIFT